MQKRIFLSNRFLIENAVGNNRPCYTTANVDVREYNKERKLEKSLNKLLDLSVAHGIDKETKKSYKLILHKLRTDELIDFLHSYGEFLANFTILKAFFSRYSHLD